MIEDIPIGLTYLFNHMKFEFKYDGEIIITDRQYRKKYRMTFNHDPDIPFQIQLLKKDVEE